MTTLAYRSGPAPLTFLVQRVRRSRSLASMLPALLSSGVMTFVITGVMHLMWSGIDGRWIESWLTAWPIAFPVAYVVGPLVSRLSAATSAPAARTSSTGGLAFADIADVSQRVTARHGYPVLRGLKPANDFSAV
ncbi:MAG TPA: DUF2798 domain-containing protein [Noviherbaspirillum sp.]|uniref:DUF2798 domain-containing protein n=1 Tax=Noviherbaspirillum sp. TaxID=1926288 RepID=UPI002D58E667|nr:DUF2798 domain-containing protein [Noviherbaspirillum sp.]HYD96960.1 DUF2798 domain-containing protein [Noviherbaspirillum sp.]